MEHPCYNEERIRSLENDRTESKVYIKQINENIHEIKTDIRGLKKSPQEQTNDISFKQTVILELIKVIAMLTTVVGAIFGAIKILDK